jgi:lauroyl/myristoyl acyltransferase
MIGAAYYLIKDGERKATSKSLRRALKSKFNKHSVKWIVLKTYKGIIDHYFEKMINAYNPPSTIMKFLKSYAAIQNQQWLDEKTASGKGCLFVSGHFGSVEYIPLLLTAYGYHPTIIVRYKTEKLKQVLSQSSQYVDLDLIDADQPNVVFKALEAIRNGRTLITLCDKFKHWIPCKTTKTYVFGQALPRDRSLDIIYRRAKVPTCLGLLYREKKGGSLKIYPISDGKDNISLSEQAWKLMEEKICRFPEQWYQWPNLYKDIKKYNTFRNAYANKYN